MIRLNVKDRNDVAQVLFDALGGPIRNIPPMELRIGNKAIVVVPGSYSTKYSNDRYCCSNFEVDVELLGFQVRDIQPEPEVARLRESLKLVEAQRDANAARVKDLEDRFDAAPSWTSQP